MIKIKGIMLAAMVTASLAASALNVKNIITNEPINEIGRAHV